VCCATKRQVEIACPPDCHYLLNAREHPAAVVTRQRDRDLRFMMPHAEQLSEQAWRLLVVFQLVVRRHRAGALPPLGDATVAEAARTLAATLETSAKGIIYEHQAGSLPAQRLVIDLRTALDEVMKEIGPAAERDAAAALRALEDGAARAVTELANGSPSGVEYLDFLERLPRELEEMAPGEAGQAPLTGVDLTAPAGPAPSRIIMP
jgi:hypothetical protein